MAEQGQKADQDDRSPGRRESVVDRRTGVSRRGERPAAKATNLERRRGPGRRRTDFMRAAEEGEMTQEQFMFVMAIDSFKRVNGLTFPTWTRIWFPAGTPDRYRFAAFQRGTSVRNRALR